MYFALVLGQTETSSLGQCSYMRICFTNPLQNGTSHFIAFKLSLTSLGNVSFNQCNFDSNCVYYVTSLIL